MPAPATWTHFAQYLRLPDALAAQWWRALGQARWSDAVSLRQSFLLHAAVRLDTKALAHKTASPQALATVLSNLEKECVLSHRTANQLLEYVLGCTDSQGHWQQRLR
jgi:hypothetical protein